MKFWEAMKALEEGKKIRRINDPPEWYITIGPKNNLFLHENGKYHEKSDCPLNRVFIDEWELYEEPVQLLSFQQVIQGLKKGKRFKRKAWRSDIYLNSGELSGRVIIENNSYHTLLIEDYESTDWIEVKD